MSNDPIIRASDLRRVEQARLDKARALDADTLVEHTTLAALAALPQRETAQEGTVTGATSWRPDNQRGLYRKYRVERIGDTVGKHAGCEYFVLDLVHDEFAGTALCAYAAACDTKFPVLASDLRRMPCVVNATPVPAAPHAYRCEHGDLADMADVCRDEGHECGECGEAASDSAHGAAPPEGLRRFADRIEERVQAMEDMGRSVAVECGAPEGEPPVHKDWAGRCDDLPAWIAYARGQRERADTLADEVRRLKAELAAVRLERDREHDKRMDLAAELAKMRAQEPVATVARVSEGAIVWGCGVKLYVGMPLYAFPVPPADHAQALRDARAVVWREAADVVDEYPFRPDGLVEALAAKAREAAK